MPNQRSELLQQCVTCVAAVAAAAGVYVGLQIMPHHVHHCSSKLEC
jgi:hypothetical protein